LVQRHRLINPRKKQIAVIPRHAACRGISLFPGPNPERSLTSFRMTAKNTLSVASSSQIQTYAPESPYGALT
jgi:hypothetical protein